MRVLLSTLFFATALLAGCAAQQFVLSDRVTAHALGEIKLAYHDPLVFDRLNPLEIDLFDMTVKQQIETKLSSQLTRDQPLHLYVTVMRVVMPKKGTQVLAAFLGTSTEDRADVTMLMVPGKKDVAAPLNNIEVLKKNAAGIFGVGSFSYAKFPVFVVGGLFSKRESRIVKLAEAVADVAAKMVTHDIKK